jgi:hypothetical protein
LWERGGRWARARDAQMAALYAYREKACAARPEAPREQATGRRGCRIGYDPMKEITMLERLRQQSVGSSDEPRILERMIADWADVDDGTLRQCSELPIHPDMTVGEVEDAQKAIHTIESIHDKTESEPRRLCEELHTKFPDHVIRVSCPGISVSAIPPEPIEPAAPAAPAEPNEPDAPAGGPGWF